MERRDDEIIIDGDNDEILFQITAARVLTANIPHGRFGKNNANLKFAQITDIMNNELRMTSGGTNNDKETGTAIKVGLTKQNKVSFDLRFGGSYQPAQADITGDNHFNKLISYSAAGNLSSSRPADSTALDLNTSVLCLSDPINTACGFSRFNLRSIPDAASDFDGVVVGITSDIDAVKAGQITIATFPVMLYLKSRSRNIFVRDSFDADFVDTGSVPVQNTPAGGNNGNTFSFEFANHNNAQQLGQRSVQLCKYDRSVNPNTRTILKDVVLDTRDGDSLDDINYYIVYMFQGKDCFLDGLKHCPDPFFGDPEKTSDVIKSRDLLTTHLSGLTVPNTNRRNTAYNVTFKPSVAVYFGFNNSVQNPNNEVSEEGLFISDLLYQNLVTSDAFIVQMLNININSYDSFTKGRENLLAIIPYSEMHINTISGLVQYEPNERYYLQLGNANKLLLRNIRMRVTALDYTPIDMQGTASVVILIKSKNTRKILD